MSDDRFFDGVTIPRVQVFAAFGSVLDPGSEYLHLGLGPGLGTGLLGGVGAGDETDITGFVRSISLSEQGRSSDLDTANPVTASLVLNNVSGDFDPRNPASPYWGANRLSAQQNSLEDGTTTGWEVGGNCTLASVTTVAQAGSRSLQLTSAASGGVWANTATGTGGAPVVPGEPIRGSGWLRSAAHSVTGTVCVMYWSSAGVFVDQDNSAGIATSTSAWVEQTVDAVVPAGAAYASMQALYASALAASEVHYADNFVLQGNGIVDGLPVRVRWSWDGEGYNHFYGELSELTHTVPTDWDITAALTALDGLERLGRAYLPSVGTPEGDGDETGTRIGLLADDASWPSSLRLLDTGYSRVAPTRLGAMALELMRQSEQTEYGFLFVDGTGRLVFYDRHRGATDSRSTTVQATFGDAAGAIPIQGVSVTRGRAGTFNRAAITRDAVPVPDPIFEGVPVEADQPVEQVADDAVTQATKGVLAFPADVGKLFRADEESLALAQYLVARYKTTQDRISSISVDCLSVRDSDQWGTLLGLGPLDRIEISQDYGAATITTELLIQGVSEEIQSEPPVWTLTFSTANPPPDAELWLLGDATDGVLGTAKLAW